MKKTYQFLKKIPLFLAAMLLWGHTIAQPVTVTGKVFDSTNKSSIPGVTIIIKGSTVGTVSDMDGNFSLQASKGAVLEFLFMGYMQEEVTVGDKTVYNVGLVPGIEMLSEVVVIGYGTQKKSDRTGSVAHVTSEELSGGVLTDPIQAMVGKAAGVSITKKGGDPNGGFSVKIRGSSGLYSGTEPLYVIDGVPGADPTTVAPDDIESFNILKDASSTAIYGSRGANGVIIITTKKGSTKTGSTLEYNSYVSMDYVAKRLDLMSADEYRVLLAQYPERYTDILDGGASVNWQDEIFRRGFSQNHNVSGSGAFDNGGYRFSINHTGLDGVILGTGKDRTIGKINTFHQALENRLKIDATLSATFEKNSYVDYGGNGSNDILYQAFQRNPTDPILDSAGNFYEIQRDFNYYNPVALIHQIQNERQAKRYLGNIKTDFEIIEGLTASINLGYNRHDAEYFYFEPKTVRGGTSQGFGRRNYENWESRVAETTLSYANSFSDVHNVTGLLGYSFQEDFSNGFFASGKNPLSDFMMSNNLGMLAEVNPRYIGSYKSSNKLISMFGRATYNYNSKYYLTGTVRRDGSTRFGKNNEWGIFPSASVAWNIKDENFLVDFNPISLLKLRVGYGLVGNQEIGNYLDIMTATAVGTTIDPETGLPTIEFQLSHNANPDLKWEENSEINIGIDFGVLNNRVSGSFDFYDKMTYDLLAPYNVPVPPNALSTTWANVGSIRNRGIELQLQAFVMDDRAFKWKTIYTFSKNKQTVEELSNDLFSWTERKEGWLSGRGLVGDENWTQMIRPGWALGTFYMPEYAGLSADGKFLFFTAAGGVTRDISKAERRVMGTAQPIFEMGWSNFFTIYKNLDVSFALRWVHGFDVLNVTRMVFENPSVIGTLNGLNSVADEIERGVTDFPKVNSYYLEDGSFLRMDNITVGYTFDVSKVKWLGKARLYASTNNLFIITGYTGLDPEISYNGLSFGLDQYNVYPKTRNFTAGVNITF